MVGIILWTIKLIFINLLFYISDDILPKFAENEKTSSKILPAFDVTINKNDENSSFDEKQLLTIVPKNCRKNAKELLRQFDLRANELTWNSSGTIFIDQVAIPNSNIFILFPLLFRKQEKKDVIGFLDFLNKINEMGLQSLIQFKKNIVESKGNGSGKSNERIQWWYLGD